MKFATQSRPEFIHIAKLIEDIPIAMLTTMQDDGAMASRPMAALEMDEHGAIWFLTDRRSSKVECLHAANYWDGPNSTMVRAFGMIASVIAGKPVGMGEYGTHTGLSAPAPASALST